MHGIRRFACLAAAGCLALFAGSASAQGLGGAVELVDPHTLRVCADPNNLPFSNRQGEGFENKIADLFGRKLHESVAYTYYPQVVGFFRNTLAAFRCDLVMGVVQSLDLVMTTRSYYHTSYALVFKPGDGLDGVTSLEDPRLKGKRLGVVARTPPATLMVRDGLMGNATPYPLTVDTRVDAPGKRMIDDLVAGRLDAAVLWGPIAGFDAMHAGTHLIVTPLLSETGVPMAFGIAMGVRHGDKVWRRTIDRLIAENQEEIDRILRAYHVPLLDAQGQRLAP